MRRKFLTPEYVEKLLGNDIDLRSQAEREIARITGRLQGEPLDARSGRGDAPAYERTVRGALNRRRKARA